MIRGMFCLPIQDGCCRAVPDSAARAGRRRAASGRRAPAWALMAQVVTVREPVPGSGNVKGLCKVEHSRLKSFARQVAAWQTCVGKTQLRHTITQGQNSWHER